MNIKYNTSKEIVQRFYADSVRYWRMAGMSIYQAIRKAEQEVLELKVNPFTGEGKLDARACKDFVSELQGGVSA
jgi:hypothetical protein